MNAITKHTMWVGRAAVVAVVVTALSGCGGGNGSYSDPGVGPGTASGGGDVYTGGSNCYHGVEFKPGHAEKLRQNDRLLGEVNEYLRTGRVP